MLELNEKILKAIQEDLPQATAGELKLFIEQANADKKLLVSLQNQITEAVPLLKERQDLLNSKSTAEGIRAQAESKMKELDKKEQDLKLQEKDLQINALKEVNGNMFTIMQLFVKNPRSIEIMNNHTSENQAGYYNGQFQVQPSPVSKFEQKTTEHKQIKEDSDLHAN